MWQWILFHWWNDVLSSVGDCLLISKSPEKKVTAVNFWKYERGDRSVHLNHVKSLTWAVRSLVIYSKWYTVSWNWWKINRIGIGTGRGYENNNVKKAQLT